MRSRELFRWFDGPGDVPAHDPGLEVDCPFCHAPLSELIVAVSVLALDQGAQRCYFYRMHRGCEAAATPEAKAAVDALVIVPPSSVE